jgi:small subunit ribosomal protein S17
MSQEHKSNKRTLVGYVVSNKADKTIVVSVETLVKHPLVKKFIRRKKKFMAHDPGNECGVGDKIGRAHV